MPIAAVVRALNEAFQGNWSFDIVGHELLGERVEVTGELRANGTSAREKGRAERHGVLRGRSIGELLEAASDDSLRRCALLLLNGRGLPETAPVAPPATPLPTPRGETVDAGPASEPVSTPADLGGEQVSPVPAPTSAVAAAPGDSPTPAKAPSARFSYDHLDPVTLRVVGGAFNAIAKEMAHVLHRMSYSSIIRESEDLGCGIFDVDGSELCESES
ncbi:MAG: hydantoinase B/oxoprolinase family protein, partial [SAR324 cluster bacterium]|nr:hydantoinase B/oxoprolinase family protein [SAR324 cluster bacterium]